MIHSLPNHPDSPDTRLSHVSWLVLACVLGLITLSLAQFLYRFTLPTDGWSVTKVPVFGPEQIYQTNLAGAASQLQPGDYLLAVGGVPVAEIPPGARPADWVTGQTVQLTVLRADETLTLAVPVLHWTWGHWWRYATGGLDQLAARLSAVFLLSMALFTFFRRPGDPAARALLAWLGGYFALNVSTSLPVGLTTWFDAWGHWLNYLFSYAIFLTPFGPALLSLTLVFPRPKAVVRRHPWIPLAPFAIGAVWLAIVIAFELESFALASVLLLVITSIASLAHSMLTMRDAVSRAQLQWGIGGLVLGLFVTLLSFPSAFGWVTGLWGQVSNSAFSVGFILIGAALSVAILRYRLFDIDLIIRRTLVYALLTALLALAYALSVVVLQNVFRAVTQQGQNQLVTVISTLAIAALFVPLRGRVQSIIDRRLYRRKYDAAQIVAAFGSTIRDDVELTRLTTDLIDVVDATLQPAHASLWLKTAARPGDKEHREGQFIGGERGLEQGQLGRAADEAAAAGHVETVGQAGGDRGLL